MNKTEAIEIIKEAFKGNARKEDFFKTPYEIIGDVLDEYAKAINKNSVIPDVSESNFNAAIKHIENSYCDTHLNTPYMLLGDVAKLIKILTGKEVDWQELAKHSR